MRFDDKHPNAVHDFEDTDWCVVKLVDPDEGERVCFMCEERTWWVDICFECAICSEECDQKLAEEASAASEAAGPVDVENGAT